MRPLARYAMGSDPYKRMQHQAHQRANRTNATHEDVESALNIDALERNHAKKVKQQHDAVKGMTF